MGSLIQTILLVDDDSTLRNLLSTALTHAGFAVRCAYDGLAGLEAMRSISPDLIISDLQMPRMSGFEFLSVVRRRFPNIPVIAISGSPIEELAPSDLAADAFCPKAAGDVGVLLSIIAQLADDGFSPHNRLGSSPIWVQVSNPKHSIYLNCPICLRNFPHIFGIVPLSPVDIICIHCGIANKYAVCSEQRALPTDPHFSWWRGPRFLASAT